MSGPLRNDHPVWIPGPAGPGHRTEPVRFPKRTVCRQPLAGMIRTTLVGAHIAGLPWCMRCWPEAAQPSWPMGRAWRTTK